ncbi:MAG: FAD-dependent oxidoreductase [Opitutales bacterium]|nr:FAD-dependent oxidoreductase [Opitutales bacterium]
MSTDADKPVLIVGAGMAGLACALSLHQAGLPVRLCEASDEVGGRVRTDVVEGFRLDRGFQVYLDTYPRTSQLLDLPALELRPFEPGALLYREGKLHRLMDVFRRPSSFLRSVRAPVGSLSDKLRVGWLRRKLSQSSFAEIANRQEQSTESYLRDFGFSESMIDRFFRSFYGGIFLERELQTTSRMFEFTFKLFSQGNATLPAKGMGEIPLQLARRLPKGSIGLQEKVCRVSPQSVTLASGEIIEGSATVVATDGSTAEQLLPESSLPKTEWRSTTTLYYVAAQSPVKEAILCLNGSGSGIVNNCCVLTDAAPAYAPQGQSLISVSVMGPCGEENLSPKVIAELTNWFGPQTQSWRHLRTDHLPRGLPVQRPHREPPTFCQEAGLWICGDHLSSASIEGAVVSGQQTARALLRERNIETP